MTASFLLFSVFCFQAKAQNSAKKENNAKKINYSYTGKITKNDFMNSSYTKKWFNPKYEQYDPPKKLVRKIKRHIKDYKIIAYMGNWCHDSKREIPKFYKLLDETGYDLDNLTVYAVNGRKQTKNHDEKGHNIVRVPTMIFYKDGKEVNRFVEHARESLVKDILKIVSGEPYKDITKKE